MRGVYTSPEIEFVEFDTKDIITTSGGTDILDNLTGEAANLDAGWTGLY